MKRSIFLKLKDLLQRNFLMDLKRFSAYDRISEDLGLSPYEFQELIWHLENEYNLYIPDQEIARMSTLKDLVACIDDHLQNSLLYPLFLAEAI